MIRITLEFPTLAEARDFLNSAAAPAPLDIQFSQVAKVIEKPATATYAEKTSILPMATKPVAKELLDYADLDSKTAEKAVETKKPAPTPPAQETQAAPAATATVSPSESKVDYKTLQAAVFKLAGKSKPAVMKFLADYGVKTAKDIPEAKWAAALASADAALGEL